MVGDDGEVALLEPETAPRYTASSKQQAAGGRRQAALSRRQSKALGSSHFSNRLIGYGSAPSILSSGRKKDQKFFWNTSFLP